MIRRTLSTLFGLAFLANVASAQFQQGQIYVGTYDGNVYQIDPVTFAVSTFADASDGLSGTSAVAFTPAGTMLTSNYSTSEVIEFDWLGNPTVVLDSSDGLSGPFGENGIVIDPSGQVYVGNYTSSQILRFQSDYSGMTVFADSSDGIVRPDGMAFEAGGDMIVANRESGGQILRIAPDGTTTNFDTRPATDPYSVAIRNNGDIYIASATGTIHRYIGGNPANRVKLGNYDTGNVAIAFNPGHTVLYHVSSAYGDLRTIDPDTGVDTVVATGLNSAAGIAVVGNDDDGSFVTYGSGTAGSGGFVPDLAGGGSPNIGQSVTFTLSNGLGGATTLLLVGFARANIAFAGGELLVAPPWLLLPLGLSGTAGVPGAGGFAIGGTLPNDPNLVGFKLDLQDAVFDAGATDGLALSNGLEMTIGS